MIAQDYLQRVYRKGQKTSREEQRSVILVAHFIYLFLKTFIYLSIYLFIYSYGCAGFQLQQAGSSSLTRDRTPTPLTAGPPEKSLVAHFIDVS